MSEFLKAKLSEVPQFDYPVQSRIHPLNSFPKGFFVKRDDELGFGISGCKFRKYRTLLPHIIGQGYKRVVVIGGAYSNHVLAITQLLLENSLEPVLLLKGGKPTIAQGNFFFLEMLAGAHMHWIEKSRWEDIDSIAETYRDEKTYILPEGAPLFEGFLGALTLPLDILRNEKEQGIQFEHIFMEAGTGYSAAALLLAFALFERKTTIHLLHVAEDEAAFTGRLMRLHREFENWLQKKVPFPENCSALLAAISPSFGSTNASLFDSIRKTAACEGFFLDPIYSAKLFCAARAHAGISGPALLIHSGGALSLAGFQKQLAMQ